mgnify:CR=1 FL=1
MLDEAEAISAMVNQSADPGESSKEVLEVMKPYFKSKSSRVCLGGLLILEVCVRNCGLAFHKEIATKKWCDRLVKVMNKNEREPAVKMVIVQLLVDWSDAFSGNKDLATVGKYCDALSQAGVPLPQPTPQAGQATPRILEQQQVGGADPAANLGDVFATTATMKEAVELAGHSTSDPHVETRIDGFEERVEGELRVIGRDIALLTEAMGRYGDAAHGLLSVCPQLTLKPLAASPSTQTAARPTCPPPASAPRVTASSGRCVWPS